MRELGATKENVAAETRRLVSLDQFRGYTVLGMFLVNFVGTYHVIQEVAPLLRHHHTYCSYADTIMPHFFFAVGFAFRMTLLRRVERDGRRSAYVHALRRNLGLILIGFVLYHLDGRFVTWESLRNMSFLEFLGNCKRSLFQSLVHIGVTGIWILPVITARPTVRIAFAFASAGLHMVLSHGLDFSPFGISWSNYAWVNSNPVGIDGGPLGFLAWTIPMICGTLAYDVMTVRPTRLPILKFIGWGLVLMVLGYGLSCFNRITPPNANSRDTSSSFFVEPPFVSPAVGADLKPNMWTMSLRSASVSYMTFATGFSLGVFALFVILSDRLGWQLGLLRTLGTNALAGYIIHGLVDDALKPYTPRDAPLWYVLAALGVFLAICFLLLRHLEKHRLFLRL